MELNSNTIKNAETENLSLDELVDIRDVTIDTSLPFTERIINYIQQIKNPYCYKCGDIAVKIKFADTDVTMEECMESYLRNI